MASRQCWDGFPQDAPFGSGVEEIEHEPGDEFWVVGDGDVTEAVEPPELRVGINARKRGDCMLIRGSAVPCVISTGQVIRSRPVGMSTMVARTVSS